MTTDSEETSTISLHLSSASESSLLEEDVFLSRLELLEKTLIMARDAIVTTFRTSRGERIAHYVLEMISLESERRL